MKTFGLMKHSNKLTKANAQHLLAKIAADGSPSAVLFLSSGINIFELTLRYCRYFGKQSDVIGNTMATVPNNRLYPIRLWLLTTIIVGPILLGLGGALYDASYYKNSANIGVIFLFILFGLAFSLPTFMVVWLAHSSLEGRFSPVLLKWLLVILAVIGVFVTFSFIGGSMARTYSLFYAAAVIVSGLVLQSWKS